MKNNSRAVLAVAAAIAFGLTFTPVARAADGQTQTKKTTSQRHVRPSQARVPQSKPAVPQNSCDYDRAAGNCVIDLGYGRCLDCSAGPFN